MFPALLYRASLAASMTCSSVLMRMAMEPSILLSYRYPSLGFESGDTCRFATCLAYTTGSCVSEMTYAGTADLCISRAWHGYSTFWGTQYQSHSGHKWRWECIARRTDLGNRRYVQFPSRGKHLLLFSLSHWLIVNARQGLAKRSLMPVHHHPNSGVSAVVFKFDPMLNGLPPASQHRLRGWLWWG